MPARPSLAEMRFVNPQLADAATSRWTYEVVPASAPRPIPAVPRALQADIAGAGRSRNLATWLIETHSTSLLVVDRGVVVYEWYADQADAADLFLGASMTKSALSLLVGIAVADGALAVGDEVLAHLPELAGSGYAGCTVEHLLTMTTGVDWVEDHRDPTSPASRLVRCFAESTADSRDLLRGIGTRTAPGTRFEYCTADSQVLDWVRERATGVPYIPALEALWRALGCESDAVVATDFPGGVALAGGGLAATSRDWARLVGLQVDGAAAGERVVGPDWAGTSSAPSRAFLAPGRLPSAITTHAGFGYHWWPLDDAGRRVTADGSRGQFGYVDRDLGVVVVKTSLWPYDDWLVDRQHRDLSYLGLPLIACAAAAARPDEQEPR